MPNWCENDLTVTGRTEDVDAFLADASGKNHCDDSLSSFCFDNFLPYPKKFLDLDKEAARRRAEVMAMPPEERGKLTPDETFPKDGYNQGGYEWCICNWGTKWPACHERDPVVKSYRATKRVKLVFDTAWSPPGHVVLAASKKHPRVKFTLRYYERGAALCGKYICEGGENIFDQCGEYRGNRGG